MKMTLKQLKKIIRDILETFDDEKEITNNNVINLLADKRKINLEEDAKFDKDGSVILTDDLHQNGRISFKDKLDISSRPWKLSSTFYMTDNMGIKDVDIIGGDGIWFEFNGRQLCVGFDTFMNEYNQTGNEVNIFSEALVVASKYYPICFNNGKQHKIEIICKPIGAPNLMIRINGKSFMEYNFKTVDMKYLFRFPAEISASSFTGEAGSKQVITSLTFEYL